MNAAESRCTLFGPTSPTSKALNLSRMVGAEVSAIFACPALNRAPAKARRAEAASPPKSLTATKP